MQGARPWWLASFQECTDYWGRWFMDCWSKLIDEHSKEDFLVLRLVMMQGAKPWCLAPFPECIDNWGRWLMDCWSKLIDEHSKEDFPVLRLVMMQGSRTLVGLDYFRVDDRWIYQGTLIEGSLTKVEWWIAEEGWFRDCVRQVDRWIVEESWRGRLIDGIVKKIELWFIEKDLLMVLIEEEIHLLRGTAAALRVSETLVTCTRFRNVLTIEEDDWWMVEASWLIEPWGRFPCGKAGDDAREQDPGWAHRHDFECLITLGYMIDGFFHGTLIEGSLRKVDWWIALEGWFRDCVRHLIEELLGKVDAEVWSMD